MKNLYTLTLSIMILVCCEDPAEITQNETEIDTTAQNDTIYPYLIGDWKQVETLASSFGPAEWYDVEDGFVYRLKPNYIFETTLFNTFITGSYNYNDSILEIEYDDFDINFKLNYLFEDSLLVLTPVEPYCDEGCADKLIKIKSYD